MSARFIVADVFDGLATLDDGSVDLVVTSPPFLALRSYLPADHPDKGLEIGSEATPAEWLDTMLAVTAELRRVLAPHGSLCVELGDTYAGSGGAGGDYDPGGWREGQEKFEGSAYRVLDRKHELVQKDGHAKPIRNLHGKKQWGGDGWPLAKSKALIPELYRIALAYGINPLTGQPSPAGQWRVRNVVTWCRPNPPVGALGDKWRPATSDIVIACTSDKRYWDDIATRHPHKYDDQRTNIPQRKAQHASRGTGGDRRGYKLHAGSHHGAPLLDYWEIPPGGYPGSHYAVYPPALIEPLIKAMAPPKVCRTCGEPSRRIIASDQLDTGRTTNGAKNKGRKAESPTDFETRTVSQHHTLGWTDCGHNTWRPAVVLDPFAGTGTTLAVATGHGHDAIGIDLDERNYELALERVGPLVLGPPEKPQVEVGS